MADVWLPPPKDLIKNEINTLNRLRNDPLVAQYYGRLVADADGKYSYYAQKGNLSSFTFESQIEASIDRKNGKVFLGGQVIVDQDGTDYDQLSYHFAVCEEKGDDKCLFKKIHFDYTNPNSSGRLHPVFHFQFPGELTPALQSHNYEDNHLAPWLSEPRIPFYPMTLALLVNLILREFPNETTQKIIQRSEWRNMIKNNEDLVLTPYYEKCYNFITRRRNRRIRGNRYLLTSDFHYGIG